MGDMHNPSMSLSPPSSVGIDTIPSVDTLHGEKPGVALPPSHSSAGNGASG
jgi:hypothetical protein